MQPSSVFSSLCLEDFSPRKLSLYWHAANMIRSTKPRVAKLRFCQRRQIKQGRLSSHVIRRSMDKARRLIVHTVNSTPETEEAHLSANPRKKDKLLACRWSSWVATTTAPEQALRGICSTWVVVFRFISCVMHWFQNLALTLRISRGTLMGWMDGG